MTGHKMASTLILSFALALGFTFAARSQANPGPLTAEVFGALPAQTNAALSPDGRWIAWMDQTERKPRIVIFSLETHRTQRIAALPERTRLRELRWSDNETLLATLSEAGEPRVATNRARINFLNIALSPTGEGVVMLPARSRNATGYDAAFKARLIRVIDKPHTVIMSSGPELLEVNTTTGASERIKYGNEHTAGWAVGRDGRVLAREDWDYLKGAYRVYALNGESNKEILRADEGNPPQLAGVLPDDSALVVLARNGREHQSAWTLPLDGSAQKLLAEDAEADIIATYADAYSGAIIGLYVSGTKTTVQWLDATAQRRYEVLQRSFANAEVEVSGWTMDGTKTLVRVESPSSPPIYYLVDFKTHRADIAAEEYPALQGAKLGTFKQITYKARDGTSIPAYLTLPPDTAGLLPLVVLPHGVPHARDFPVFDWMVQFLATRGYAVLQPQFRGSSGFGDAFQKAGYRQWGGLMQDDVTDGVRAMIEQKIADERRVCIAGMSYGGYAALAGAAFTPDLYACAISVSGVSDLRAMYLEIVAQRGAYMQVYSPAITQWNERVGTESDPALDRKSPIHSVASIKAPIMIVYGNSDSVVPNSQSLKMAEALKSAGKKFELIKLEDEDHWLSRSDTRIQLLKAYERFLYDNLSAAEPHGK